jgi:chromosome segregation ATPase
MADDISISRRLDMVERDLRDHAKSFTALTDQASAMQQRIMALEVAFRKWEIAEARAEERGHRLNERLEKIDEDLETLRGVGTKLLWIVAGGVVTAFLAFVLQGGLVK